MIIHEENFRNECIFDVAKKIAIAARTAPKARGTDNLEIAIIVGEELESIAVAMTEFAERHDVSFFARDAENLRKSDAVVLIGTKVSCLGLNCGYCGFPTCAEKATHSQVPCFFNANDMGIAIGSEPPIKTESSHTSSSMCRACLWSTMVAKSISSFCIPSSHSVRVLCPSEVPPVSA